MASLLMQITPPLGSFFQSINRLCSCSGTSLISDFSIGSLIAFVCRQLFDGLNNLVGLFCCTYS
jgi:hypothetical protein